MNYIGSKFSLLGEIRAMLARQGVDRGTFCDLFSGTTVVAQMARLDGFDVIANDMQAYSHVMQQAFLGVDGYPAFEALRRAVPAIESADATRPRAHFGLGPEPGADSTPLRRVLAHLEDLPGLEGPFYQAYCEGGTAGRTYYSADNGRRCEAIRTRLEAWRQDGLLSEGEFYVLLASLIETVDHLANTASVYGAYLKHVKASARAPLTLRVPRLLSGGSHRACQADGAALLSTLPPFDVLYLDPPYNHRQYHANYHLLETIARWDMDAFEPQGKTGLRPSEGQRSRFCSRRHVGDAFAEVLDAARCKHVIVSYNHEGLLPEADLQSLLRAKANGGACDFHELHYKRFRADADGENRKYKGDVVREFLYYAEVKS